MKKMVKLVSATLLALFIFAVNGMAQTHWQTIKNESTQLKMNRSIRLNGDSKTEELNMMIINKTKYCRVKIRSMIEAGRLTVEIYDPSGEKHGNFSVGSQINPEGPKKGKQGKEERVHGEINKNFKNPTPGKWKIRIIPTKAKGRLFIDTRQHYMEDQHRN